ncbi:MAG: transposase [Melioribacteraceae bacterium]
MKENKIYYRRNLPHYQPEGCTFFVTFRLTQSLPLNVIVKLINEKKLELKRINNIKSKILKKQKYYEFQQKYFEIFDKYIDTYKKGPSWLVKDEVASIVKEAIHYRDGKDYKLIAYTIMPNHVHMIFTPIIKSRINENSDLSRTQNEQIDNARRSVRVYIVTKILQELKRFTALKCNKILNRHGAFWHHESYDHVIRNIDELRRIVNYILQNPVKANLIDDCDKWKWNYYNPNYLL